MLTLETRILAWEMTEPFAISRGVMTHVHCVYVELTDAEGNRGRGEAAGINYHDETPEKIRDQIEALRPEIAAGVTRADLLRLLPYGGARNALDAALWDLEAKRSGVPAWRAAGLDEVGPVVCAQTIGIRSAAEFRERARQLARFPLLKVKVGGKDDLDLIAAVHEGAPDARLIVDPNQSWSFDQLVDYAPRLADLGVALLEQPLAVGGDEGLRGYRCPVPVCADEAVNDRADLPGLVGKYDYINIKLDKTGGLTEALALAREALDQGFRLMVGCMAGSSLAMAPAAVVAQLCDFVDLDGPLLQKEDWPHAISYNNGVMSFPAPELWG